MVLLLPLLSSSCFLSILPFLTTHGTVWIIAFSLRPFFDAVDVEAVHALARHHGALVAGRLARRARRVVEVAADAACVVVGARDRAIPRPAINEMHTLDFDFGHS